MRVLLLLRSFLATLYFFAITIFCATLIVVSSLVIESQNYYDWIIQILWGRSTLWVTGIEVEVRGESYWPKHGLLVLFNHTSWVDIIVMAAKLPKLPRFGAKIELFRIPIFGKAMGKVGMLPIERHNRNKVLRIYKEAESRARQGEAFALAPEGTRQVGFELGKFKTGPFLFALGAQIPIVPLVIAGSQTVMNKKSLLINSQAWHSKVILQILPPIETRDLGEDAVASLQESLRKAMAPIYQALNQELQVV